MLVELLKIDGGGIGDKLWTKRWMPQRWLEGGDGAIAPRDRAATTIIVQTERTTR